MGKILTLGKIIYNMLKVYYTESDSLDFIIV